MATAPWYVNRWIEIADNGMQEFSESGAEIRFAYWTTLLCNGEDTYKTNNKSTSARISRASTGGGGNKA